MIYVRKVVKTIHTQINYFQIIRDFGMLLLLKLSKSHTKNFNVLMKTVTAQVFR